MIDHVAVITWVLEHWQIVFVLFYRPIGLIVKYLKSISENLIELEKRILVIETRLENAITKGKN